MHFWRNALCVLPSALMAFGSMQCDALQAMAEELAGEEATAAEAQDAQAAQVAEDFAVLTSENTGAVEVESVVPEDPAAEQVESTPQGAPSAQESVGVSTLAQQNDSASVTPAPEASEDYSYEQEPVEVPEEEYYPYQEFYQQIERDESLRTPLVHVYVDAPEGTLPEGSTMEAELAADARTLDAAVAEAVEKTGIEEERAQALAVDITFRDAEGQVVEPLGDVRVYLFTDALEYAEQLSVVHVSDQRETEVVAHLDNEELEQIDIDPEAGVVVFDAGSFSSYVLVYTVDFHYGELTYCIKGETSIALSDLFAALGIEQSAADAVDVRFSDESLLAVESIEGDWLLTSLAPFTTEETLTVTMANGGVIEIMVTDAFTSITFNTAVAPSSGAGSISASSYTTKTGDYNHGTNNNSITATASNGYLFDHWELDDVVVDNSKNGITVTADKKKSTIPAGALLIGDSGTHTLKAVFTTTTPSYTITYTASDGGSVTCASLSKTATNGSSFDIPTETASGNQRAKYTAKAVPADGYEFAGWEIETSGATITDWGSKNTGEAYTSGSTSIKPVVTQNVTLKATFRQKTSTPVDSTGAKEQIAAWQDEMTNSSPSLEKTAEVYDYDNRIYQVDLTASSAFHVIDQSVNITFITDTSRSMYFPADLENEQDYSSVGLLNWLNRQSGNGPYYTIADKDNTATMYALYKDNNKWMYIDASFYYYNDGTKTAQEVKGGNKLDNRELAGKIYTAPPKPEYESPELWTRLSYLEAALDAVGEVIYDLDPSATLGLVTFNKTAEYKGAHTSTSQFHNALVAISADGGTRQDEGLRVARENYATLFPNANSKRNVAVLITDGAPNINGKSDDSAWNEIKDKADKLTQGGRAELFTLGLSLEHVGKNKDKLDALATDNHHYNAEDSTSYVTAVEQIAEALMDKAILVGTVTDTIDPAFYPVDADGKPLDAGQTITVNGVTGTIGKSGNNWTVTWSNQNIAFPTTDSEGNVTAPGWHGTVYVKAKEDFLGGNSISTNVGDATVSANRYRVSSTSEIKNAGKTFTATADSPYVNVKELSLTQNSTEWTVYLNTTIKPEDQLKTLFDNILVKEVVSETASDKRRATGSKMQSESDFIPETFALSSLLDSDAWNTLLTEGSVSVTYNAYEHQNVGTILLTLDKSDDANTGEHAATPVGTEVESYTITATYVPNDPEDVEWDTGSYGPHPGDHGATTGTMTSVNNHIINVIKRVLQVTKVDQNGAIAKEATFTVYKADASGSAVEGLPEGTYTSVATLTTSNGVATWDYVPPTKAAATGVAGALSPYYNASNQFYLLETTAPNGYVRYAQGIPVELAMGETRTSVVSGKTADEAPYNLTQTATLSVETVDNYVTADADATSDETIAIKVRNDRALTVKKIDAVTEEPLEGATFQLKSSDGQTVLSTEVTDADGIAKFTGLSAGTAYQLVETGAPEGYVVPSDPITVTVAADGTITLTTSYADNDPGKPTLVLANGAYTITVPNLRVYALPAAGGPGAYPFLALGAFLAALAAGEQEEKRKRIGRLEAAHAWARGTKGGG